VTPTFIQAALIEGNAAWLWAAAASIIIAVLVTVILVRRSQQRRKDVTAGPAILAIDKAIQDSEPVRTSS
jgi:bacteriorhodopsin